MSIARGQKTGNIKQCLQLKITGIVQGVGFRPFVYNLARASNLGGWVKNMSDGVMVEVEGDPKNIEGFCRGLTERPPELAGIDSIDKKEVKPRGYPDFCIAFSQIQNNKTTQVPPDAAICDNCLKEIMSPSHRQYQYPFTNCTHCGPRFTIVRDVPYDRINTTMNAFIPCPECYSEYNDVSDRRFHAQPIACPKCGPQIEILGRDGHKAVDSQNYLKFFWQMMSRGSIFAVKGIGGFHLACIADQQVVELLRKRKNRPYKPFAVMCRDIETIKKYCELNKEEEEWLRSPSAPVVLLQVKKDACLPRAINPSLNTLGVMLPYSPLHSLLMEGPFDIMVLTSANPTDLPILKDNDEALEYLKDVADYFMMHNRYINQRCDDSVVINSGGNMQFHRRSRGFVPTPVKLGFKAGEVTLGTGSEMKNTFCIIKGNQAFLSQHLGEMGTLETGRFYRESLNHFMELHNLQPRIIGYDLHPGYDVSAIGKTLPVEKKYAVQHHHAHFASCLADNKYAGDAIGVILDGTGYGTDGAVWGFEIISGNMLAFKRAYHQRYTPLPGGEYSVKNPWAMALSYLHLSMGDKGLEEGQALFGSRYKNEIKILSKEVKKQLGSVSGSSCGRLFDSVAALTGICYENTYEGQAAIQLGELLGKKQISLPLDSYPYVISNNIIDFTPVFPVIIEELKKNRDIIVIAKRFHDTVVKAVASAVVDVSEKTGLKVVALSGGTWHNPYLLAKTIKILHRHNLKLMLPINVPPNDGGLSLGQAAVAYYKWKEELDKNKNRDNGGAKKCAWGYQ